MTIALTALEWAVEARYPNGHITHELASDQAWADLNTWVRNQATWTGRPTCRTVCRTPGGNWFHTEVTPEQAAQFRAALHANHVDDWDALMAAIDAAPRTEDQP